jgi:putative FmdB family regulatory protein
VPLHEFECDGCGLRTEELFKSPTAVPETVDCELCGESMRKLVSAANHSFAHTPTGPVPQNTGVKALDHKMDTVIGRDAANRWETIEARQKVKRGVLRDAHKQGVAAKPEHLVRTRDGAGDYRVITEPERKAVNARRKLVAEVSKAAADAAKQA